MTATDSCAGERIRSTYRSGGSPAWTKPRTCAFRVVTWMRSDRWLAVDDLRCGSQMRPVAVAA